MSGARTTIADWSSEFFRRVVHDGPGAIALLDVEHRRRVLYANTAMAALTGYHDEALVGLEAAALIEPADRDAFEVQLNSLVAGDHAHIELELRAVAVDANVFWVLLSASVLRDVHGRARCVVALMHDIDARKALETRIAYNAEHDPLTDLYNRRSFSEHLTRHLEHVRRYGDGGAIVLLDLDHLKQINDVHGHKVGDEVLTATAHLLRDRLRVTDTAARLGGDEFAVLLPHTTAHDAAHAIGELQRLVREQIAVQLPHGRPVTISAGVALFSDVGAVDAVDADDLLVCADIALYIAKAKGGDACVVYDADSSSATAGRIRRVSWSARVRSALAGDHFVLYRQPIVDLSHATATRDELLLRLLDDGELMLPHAFMEASERSGLIADVDRWVIHNALAYLATRPAHVIHINLSAVSISSAQTPGFIADELAHAGVDPRAVVFEVTETAAIGDMQRARAFVTQISELGCAIALDDFGAGFGSFYYLKYFPTNLLKINGEFIRHLPSSRPDRAIIQAIVAMAHSLGKQTIAEHVQDDATLTALTELGVDYAQGFHIARPTPIAGP